MRFDYGKWRMWTRDVKRVQWLAGMGPLSRALTPTNTRHRTDFWFNHYCNGQLNKPKGKVRPPDSKKARMYENGYLIRYCQLCGAKMDSSVQDYFAKALELWRLADPNR